MTKDTKNHSQKHKYSSPLPLILVGVGLIVIAVAFVIFTLNTENLATGPSTGNDSASAPGEINYPAPELTLTDMQDQAVSLADYKGQWVLVNNWATWCPPCRAEMPDLDAYYQAHKNEGFILIGISSGDTKTQIENFTHEYGLSFPMWQDPTGASLRAFRMNYLPSSFVIDPSGNVVLVWTGAVSLETLEDHVTPLLHQ